MKVAIIGAGSSGLTCIKSCNDEGLEPVCFEEEDKIGGLWRFTEEERHSSVYRSTVINTSKEMMCFSDFPIPKDFPPFMHNSKIMEYFHMYAKAFDLYKFIRFTTKVVDIRKTADFDDSGKWEVLFRELNGADPEAVKVEVYDAVMSCVGHHSEPSWPTPSFPGQDEFEGLKMHSHSYKDFKPFENKKVLIVGKSAVSFIWNVFWCLADDQPAGYLIKLLRKVTGRFARKSTRSTILITWRISARAEISVQPGLWKKPSWNESGVLHLGWNWGCNHNKF